MKIAANQIDLQTKTVQAKGNKQASENGILQKYKTNTTQLKTSKEGELLQGKFEVLQKMGLQETTQRKFETTQLVTEEEEAHQAKSNNTGLPDNLKNGIENLSGYGMNDVKVHYNSSQPSTLQAHAYAQGTDIHLAPGQEKHLAHEAWHVVQQKQGRVKPTKQLKGTTDINDDEGLEKEADVMGNKALQMKQKNKVLHSLPSTKNKEDYSIQKMNVIQRAVVPVVGAGVNVNFSPEDTVKRNELVQTLQDFGNNVLPLGNWTLLITFDNDMDLNPASTNANIAGQTITIDIRHWVLRKNDVGFILAMIAHEIGAHTLADQEMTPAETNQEALQNGNNTNLMIMGTQRTLTPVNGAGRQQDHVNSAKVDLFLNNFSPRALHYLNTVIRLGNSIVNTNIGNGGVNGGVNAATIPQLTELMHTYLFDIARIIVDNDRNNPGRIFWNADQAANAMNWLMNIISVNAANLPTPPLNNWLAQVPMNESGNSVRLYLIKKLAGYAAAWMKHKWSGHL